MNLSYFNLVLTNRVHLIIIQNDVNHFMNSSKSEVNQTHTIKGYTWNIIFKLINRSNQIIINHQSLIFSGVRIVFFQILTFLSLLIDAYDLIQFRIFRINQFSMSSNYTKYLVLDEFRIHRTSYYHNHKNHDHVILISLLFI